MDSKGNDLMGLLDIALGIAKDKAFDDALVKVQVAQREYLITEADCKRAKVGAVIDSMARLDISIRKLNIEYRRIEEKLTPEARALFTNLFEQLQKQRGNLLHQKKQISSNGAHLRLPSENVNGIELLPGDVLAASRMAGLYQHFAIYVGNQQVIHYAAENGDFSGHISIHEAPYSEFQGDSTFVYVLDFPDSSGRPTKRGTISQFENSNEAPFFDLVRQTNYHLYTPEETIQRAKSRIGEEKYTLPFNNCEHFAIWCKTGVHESHQVNVWLTRLSEFARRYNKI